MCPDLDCDLSCAKYEVDDNGCDMCRCADVCQVSSLLTVYGKGRVFGIYYFLFVESVYT